MKVKDIIKEWKRQLKEQGLWDKEVWSTSSRINRFESMLITLPKDKENGIDHLQWIRLSYMCSDVYGDIAKVTLTDR